jgi:hypothetical protein
MIAPTADTSEDATAPTAHGRSFTLRLWGIDAGHIQSARQDFAFHPSRNYWHVTDTEVDEAPISTIPNFDPDAIAQRARYGWAWAVYGAKTVRSAA